MKFYLYRILVVVSVFFTCASAFSEPVYSLTVRIKEPALKAFEDFASASVRLEDIRYAKSIRVYDQRKTPIKCKVLNIEPGKMTARVLFSSGRDDTYLITWGGEAAPAEELAVVDTGYMILDDYFHPDCRTSGTWVWKKSPRISGEFSHTDFVAPVAFHSLLFRSPQRWESDNILRQLMYIDPQAVPDEIMIELWSPGKKTYFSWGRDVIRWKNMNKVSMGALPGPGLWQMLEIPFSKTGASRNVEITGIGFYHANGSVFWDRTTIGAVPLETSPVAFRKKGKRVSAYFTADIQGPIKSAERAFSLIALDGSSSSGASSFKWKVANSAYSGKIVEAAVAETAPVSITLIARGKKGEQDVCSETVLIPQGEEAISLSLSNMPHDNFVWQKEKFLLPVRVTNRTGIPLPLAVRFGKEEIRLRIFPGSDAAQPAVFSVRCHDGFSEEVQVLVGREKVASRKYVFLPIETAGDIDVKGPYFADKDGNTLILCIPQFVCSSGFLPGDGKLSVCIAGDYPEKLENYFREHPPGMCQFYFTPEPSGEGYRMLLGVAGLLKWFRDKKFDVIVLFPPKERIAPDEWEKAVDAMLWISHNRSKAVVIVSPCPQPGKPAGREEIFLDIVARRAATRKAGFLNLMDIFTKAGDWQKFFTVSNGVYADSPDEEGIAVIASGILSFINQRHEQAR